MRRRLGVGAAVAAAVVALTGGQAAAASPTAAETVRAREHFFGAEHVDARGRVRSDRVILSWFSVASLAMAIDGRVVLLDTYIHKAEDKPNYVPTTTDELVALRPEAILVGHGHFDHANTAGEVVARTGAVLVGTPEHCDQTTQQAVSYGSGRPVRCVATVSRGSAPGAQYREIRPLGRRVRITTFKHVHSAAEPPDGENHETSLGSGAVPDANLILLHPPGPSLAEGLATRGDEGSSLLYQFRIGRFSLVWHDTVGPLRERAPQIFRLLRRLPATDVEFGSTLGFNDPTNGQRDPVDYLATLRPKLFYPLHHDFVAEYGASKNLEGVFRREMAKRRGLRSEVRWLYDPFDYLRPRLATFDVEDPRFTGRRCLARRSPIGARNVGRVGLGRTRRQFLRRLRPTRRTRHTYRWCVKRSSGRVTAVFPSRSRRSKVVLVTTTARAHGNRGVRAGSSLRRVRRAFPRLRRVRRGLYRAGPRSLRLIGFRRGRVRFHAVAERRLLRDRRALRRALRRAGIR